MLYELNTLIKNRRCARPYAGHQSLDVGQDTLFLWRFSLVHVTDGRRAPATCPVQCRVPGAELTQGDTEFYKQAFAGAHRPSASLSSPFFLFCLICFFFNKQSLAINSHGGHRYLLDYI